MTEDNFEYPEFYSFPPFFTIQPVEATKEKQLALWRELIIRYYTTQKIKTLIVHECPLWKNTAIERQLSQEAIDMILHDLMKSGRGEWLDPDTHTAVRILWRTPSELATDIYEWALACGNVAAHTICTIYELHSGEDIAGMSFQGCDEDLLRRALTILEEDGKCILYPGETSAEDGIKFY